VASAEWSVLFISPTPYRGDNVLYALIFWPKIGYQVVNILDRLHPLRFSESI
jgi:hypothetical protein